MLTAPDVEVSAPPDIVIPALAVSAFVPLARVPPERVSSPDVVSWLWRVRVPPLTVSAPKEALPPTRRFPVPENVTVELVAVKVVAEDVSQFPELIVIVADANVKVAAPLEVRLFVPNATLPAFVKASVPVHVRDPVSVVVPAPPAIVSVPPTSRLFAAIVNVTVEAPELNVTFPANSRVGLPNVIVREAEELKVIGATKLHEADVEEFVHDPDAVQEPP